MLLGAMNLVHTRHFKNYKHSFLSLLVWLDALWSQNPFGRNNAYCCNFCHQQLFFPTLGTFPWIIHHGADDCSIQTIIPRKRSESDPGTMGGRTYSGVWPPQLPLPLLGWRWLWWWGHLCSTRVWLVALLVRAPKPLLWDLEHAPEQLPLLPPPKLRHPNVVWSHTASRDGAAPACLSLLKCLLRSLFSLSWQRL